MDFVELFELKQLAYALVIYSVFVGSFWLFIA